MAKKIAVISTYGDEPTGEVLKKSVAALQVRRLLADWVQKGVSIRLRPIREVNLAALPSYRDLTPRNYIPENMPTPEVRNIKFIPPYYTENEPHYATVRSNWDWSAEATAAV